MTHEHHSMLGMSQLHTVNKHTDMGRCRLGQCAQLQGFLLDHEKEAI